MERKVKRMLGVTEEDMKKQVLEVMAKTKPNMSENEIREQLAKRLYVFKGWDSTKWDKQSEHAKLAFYNEAENIINEIQAGYTRRELTLIGKEEIKNIVNEVANGRAYYTELDVVKMIHKSIQAQLAHNQKELQG